MVEKQNDFSDQKCNDSQPEKSLRGDGWCRTKLQNFIPAKLKVNFFVLIRIALLVLQPGLLIGVKKQSKLYWYVKFSQWKGEFWIQEVITARLDTCLRLSKIDEIVSRRCKLRKTSE